MDPAAAPDPEQRQLNALLDGLDRGIEAHLAWNQRLFRTALLRETPGDDMRHPQAHTLCQFGRWLLTHQAALAGVDAALTHTAATAHQQMHDAVRALCERLLQGEPASPAELQAYETGQSAMVNALNALRERASQAVARLDALTGLPLRHGLEHVYALRQKDARRGHSDLWVAMIDADRFKLVNDTHGHAAGDVALQHMARRLAGCLRETDALFRYGGEEFVALILVRDEKDARQLGQRLVDAVNAHPVTTAGGAQLHLSVTVGLARVQPHESPAHAIDRADQAMLMGKARGRNRYMLAD